MRSSWRRSTALILALTVAMLLGLAGLASAEITGLTITKPTISDQAFAKPGGAVDVTVELVLGADTEALYMRGTAGILGSVPNFQGPESYLAGTHNVPLTVNINSGEPEGVVGVTVEAYLQEGVPPYTEWVITSPGSVIVDATPPVIDDDSWKIGGVDAHGDDLWVNSDTVTLTVKVSDPGADATPPTGSGIADPVQADVQLTGTGSVNSNPVYDQGQGLVTIGLTGLADGQHTLTLTVRDKVGNESTESVTFYVDTVKPVIDDESWEIDGVDAHGDDLWVNSATVTLTVAVSDTGSGVAVPASGDAILGTGETGEVDGVPTYDSGLVTIKLKNLGQGSHTLTLTIRDNVGNECTESVTFYVDTVKPVIDDESWEIDGVDAHGDDLWVNSATVTLTVAVSDTGSGVAVPASGDAILGTGETGEVDGVPTYDSGLVTIKLKNLGQGSHTLTLTIRDNVGNECTESVTFYVDTVKPVIDGVWSYVPAPYVDGGSRYWMSERRPTISVGASDEGVNESPPTGSGIDSSSCWATLNGDTVTSSGTPRGNVSCSSGSITVAFTRNLSEGEHTLEVGIDDNAGNSAEPKSTVFNIDRTPPTKPVISPYGPYTNDNTPNIEWAKSTDTGSGVKGYRVRVQRRTAIIFWSTVLDWTLVDSADTTSLSDDWWASQTLELAPDGVYRIHVSAVDNVENESAHDEVQITVDTVHPTLSNAQPITGAYVGATAVISSRFSDESPSSGLDRSETELTLLYVDTGHKSPVDNGEITGSDGSSNAMLSHTHQFTGEDGLDGEWTATMVAWDRAGNKSIPQGQTEPGPLEWSFFVDTTPPKEPGEPYAGNKHDDGPWYINTLRPTFRWAASEDPYAPDETPGSGLKEYWFQFGTEETKPDEDTDAWSEALVNRRSSSPVVPTPGAKTQQWTPSIDLLLVAGEEYSARVKAVDNVGNATVWIDPLIIYDPDPPSAVADLEGDSDEENRRPTFTWGVATDDISGVDGYTVRIRRLNSVSWDILNTFVDFPDGETGGDTGTVGWQIGFELDLGQYVISVAARDVAGNEGPDGQLGFLITDDTPPDKPVMFGIAPYINGNWDDTVTLIWTAVRDAVEYRVAYEGGTNSRTETVAVQTLNLKLLDLLELTELPVTDGIEIKARVQARDAVGNWTDYSNEVSTTIDSREPELNTEPPVPTGRMRVNPTWWWSADDGEDGSGVDYYIVTLDNELPTRIDYQPGNTSFTPSSRLADGSHQLKVKAVDRVGNVSDEVAFEAILIDTTPPPVPGMPVPDETPTKNTTPTWTWDEVYDEDDEDSDFAYYNVYADGVKIIFVEGEEPTTGSYTSAPLTHGLHVLEVTSVDKLDNESAKSTAGHVFIDLEKPTEPIMNPMPEYSKKGPVTFSWSASSDDLAVEYKFQYQVGAGSWSDIKTTVGQSCTVEPSEAEPFEGVAVVQGRVWAVDKVGNTSLPDDEDVSKASTEQTTIDAAAPTPVAGKFSPAGEVTTGEARPTWTWEFTDAGSGLDYYIVAFDEEASFRTTATSFRPASKLDSGVYVLKVEAVDKVGNKAEYTFPDVTVDVTPPPVPGMPVPDETPTKNTTPIWTWDEVYDEDDEDSDFAYYNVYADGVKIIFVEGEEPTTGSYTSAPLTHGLHVLEVTSVDKLDNESAKSTAGHVFIDLEKPTEPIMNPMPEYSKKGPITFSWSASSDDLAVKYRFRYSVDSQESWTTTSKITQQFYTVDAGEAAHGTKVYGQVKAIDAVENDSDYSALVWTTIDDLGPEVSITNPTAEVTTNAATFTYEWTAEDDGSGVDYCTVVFNGGEHTVKTPVDPDAYAWTATLKEGENIFEVWATDMLGNKSKAVAPVVTQVKPQIVLMQPMPGAKYKINEISTIAFQVIGLIVDGDDQYLKPEVLLNGVKLDAWRIVSVVPPPMAKFYVLLDSDVMVPGTMGVRIKVGAGSELFIYTVDPERSGFGFGRLRPW